MPETEAQEGELGVRVFRCEKHELCWIVYACDTTRLLGTVRRRRRGDGRQTERDCRVQKA